MPKEIEEIIIKMIKGECNYKSANLGFNLLITRLCRKYQDSPTADMLKNCTEEARSFVEKYLNIMQKEFDKILSA